MSFPSVTPPYNREGLIERVNGYMGALRTTDVATYESVAGLLDQDLIPDTPFGGSREMHTWLATKAIGNYHDHPSDETHQTALMWRTHAASHVVRAMVQGGHVPVEDFEHVIGMAHRTISFILDDATGKKAKKRLREELDNVIEMGQLSGNLTSIRRAELAYSLVLNQGNLVGAAPDVGTEEHAVEMNKSNRFVGLLKRFF